MAVGISTYKPTDLAGSLSSKVSALAQSDRLQLASRSAAPPHRKLRKGAGATMRPLLLFLELCLLANSSWQYEQVAIEVRLHRPAGEVVLDHYEDGSFFSKHLR